MSEEANPQAAVVPSSATEPAAVSNTVTHPEVKADANEAVASGAPAPEASSEPKEVAIPTLNDAPTPAETTNQEEANDKQITSSDVTQDNPAPPREDVEMADSTKLEDTVPTADGSAGSTTDAPASAGKAKPRRKSGIPEHKGKKLNKKASKAKMIHSDAKPGDYFYVRLKGYPLWPAIVCDESMLPNTLIKSRPVTAARPDGSYRADFEDGGPKVKDRSFPVMYLHTNEFGWIPNKDLVDLDFDDVGNVSASMRKDLAAAHQLAAEQHDLEYFKEILKNFMEAREAERAAKEAAKAEKKAKKAAAKKEKKTPKIVEDGDDEDVDMVDAPGEVDSEAPGMMEVEVVKTSKKRKSSATADDTPQRDSVKKPRPNIKLTTTPKATNGTSTPKSTKEHSTTKSTKPKTKKSTTKAPETPEVVAPKEPEMTAEEKRAKKEKEILFLRHKLQKGLLTRDQDPKEEEMKQMSEYVLKLEGYADLEVSIIRATKINKVLKAILKLNTIPKEEDFRFKPRSQTLLDKWNKLLASEQGTPVAAPAVTNGAAAETRTELEESKASPVEPTNGSKESPSEAKVEEKTQEDTSAAKSAVPETKNIPAAVETAPAPSVDEPSKESIPPSAPVETSA